MSVFDDPFASDADLDRAIGIPSMAELLGHHDSRCPITPDKFALPTRPSCLGRERGGTVPGSSSPGAPDSNTNAT